MTSEVERRCYLCNSNDSTVLISAEKKVHAPQHHVTYRYCKHCSFVFLDINYEAWKSKYREVYNDTAAKWKRWIEQQRREGQKLMEYQKKFIPTLLQAGQRVLDVGCSICGFLSVYKEHGWEVYGVEPNPILTKHARQRFGIDAQTAFYSPKLFPRENFDLIISYGTLEHTINPFEVVQAFNFHLKKGGFLHLELPNLLFTDIYQLGWGHVSMFTPNILSQLLEKSGFEIVNFHPRKLFPEYTDSMGFICRKVCPIEKASPYLIVDSNWRKDNQFFLKCLLNFEFHYGTPIAWHFLVMLLHKLGLITPAKYVRDNIKSLYKQFSK